MTNQEAAEIIQNDLWIHEDKFPQDQIDAMVMAIKALEQELIFDKIRAEIKLLSNSNPSYWHSGYMVVRDDVLDILDKYRADSEDEE